MWFLNPDYIIRPDAKRYLLSDKLVKTYDSDEVMTFIHPIHAWVLSLFSEGCKLEDGIRYISIGLNITEEKAKEFISPWLENKKQILIKVDGANVIIPKNILIHRDRIVDINNICGFVINKPDRIESVNLACRRHQVPYLITLMLTNKCVTKCSYCYADTKTVVDRLMPLNKIIEIINQAKEIGVHNINVIGGEVFLYPKWWIVIKELLNHGFNPSLISTKIPITHEIANHIKEIEYNGLIQLSIDSFDGEYAHKMLGRNWGYISAIKKGIEILEDKQIPYRIETVLTKDNATKENIDEMISYFRSKKYIVLWEIREAMFSHYKSDSNFDEIKASKDTINEICDYINNIKGTVTFPIIAARKEITKTFFSSKEGSSSFVGAGCSALNHHFFILPDGQCTICEQLYWNPYFIIGNVLFDNIISIWNSERVYELLNISQNNINIESACHKCSMFEDCFRIHRNRCWSDIIKAYGNDKWDFPDPRCCHAPQLCYDIEYK